MAAPTQARAIEYFNYDAETGVLLVKHRHQSEFDPAGYARHLKRVGKPAGKVDANGYVKVHMDGYYYPAHKVIWLIVIGEWVQYPDFEIDHKNGVTTDNRWGNLRKATKSENQRNSGKRVNNTSGVHGVNWKKKKLKSGERGVWVARIWNGPRHVYLGSFHTLHEATIARRAAERVLGFTRTGEPPSERAVLKRSQRLAASSAECDL